MNPLPSVGAFTINDLHRRSDLNLRASTCNGSDYCRTGWSITISCVVTILASAWIAIRPNVPYPIKKQRMKKWERFLYEARVFVTERVFMLVLFLLFPEFIVAYALRQRSAANHYANQARTYTFSHMHRLNIIHE
jgi:hypothetical protein